MIETKLSGNEKAIPVNELNSLPVINAASVRRVEGYERADSLRFQSIGLIRAGVGRRKRTWVLRRLAENQHPPHRPCANAEDDPLRLCELAGALLWRALLSSLGLAIVGRSIRRYRRGTDC